MTEPENHTLHLLREIREDVQKVDRKVDALDRKVDRNHDDLKERIGGLTRTLAGEMSGGWPRLKRTVEPRPQW